MASQVGQGQLLEQQAQAQQLAAKGDNAPVLQQLNMTSLRTRTQDLHTAIGRILHSFLTNPSTKWYNNCQPASISGFNLAFLSLFCMFQLLLLRFLNTLDGAHFDNNLHV